MKTILLLKEKSEAANAIPSNLPRLTTKERDATPGCTSDRWGHPCSDWVEPKRQGQSMLEGISSVKKRR
jgi:hypothetical protein